MTEGGPAAPGKVSNMCKSCETLKANGSPFRCNHCRRTAPTATESRQAAITALVAREGLTFTEAPARVGGGALTMAEIRRVPVTAEMAANAAPSWGVSEGDDLFVLYSADEPVSIHTDVNEAEAALLRLEGVRFA